MANFRFKAMTAEGAIIRVNLEAPSEAAAIQLLRNEGTYPLSNTAGNAWLAGLTTTTFRWGQNRHLVQATRQLASLLESNVELDRALGMVARAAELGSLREPLTAVRARVRDGAGFADALAEQRQFSKFYLSMVRSGEMGGTLDKTMVRLSEYLLRSNAIRQSVISALVYPAILLVSALLSVGVIVFFVLPEFEPLFTDAGHQMPLPARLAMGFGDFVRGYWWLLLASIGGVAVWLRHALATERYRNAIHIVLLRLPVFGELLRTMEVERFMRCVGTSLQNGVPLPAALSLAKDVLWSRVIADAVAATAASLREGESLCTRLAETGVFPVNALDLVAIGEETGRLDEMLLRQADFDEERTRNAIDRLLALLVPAMTVSLGLLVGGLIASMLSAILSINDLALQ